MATIPPKYPLIEYMKVQQYHDALIKQKLEKSADYLQDLLSDMVGKPGIGNEISRIQMRANRSAILSVLNEDWAYFDKVVENGVKNAASAASEVVSTYENTLLKLALKPGDLKILQSQFAQSAALNIDALLTRTYASGVPLSPRIYKGLDFALGYVDARIDTALATGMSQKQFAKSIASLFNPNVPGGVSYAALRTARTEINNAYHASANKRYKDSGLVEAVDWHLSTSHPEGDICDQMAADSPYPVDEVPVKPHPQCFCFTTPALPSPEEFQKKLLAGEYGDEPWAPEVMDSEVNFNMLAKEWKIKATTLSSSGATPVEMRDYLRTLSKKEIAAIKKLPSGAQQVAWSKAGKNPLPANNWVGAPKPLKPDVPSAPVSPGRKAFDQWEVDVKQRFKDFAAKTGNAKNDLTKSNNWPQFQRVMDHNDSKALLDLLDGNYIDKKLFDDARAAMKKATTPSAADAAKYKKLLGQYADDLAKYDEDILAWREANGITNEAKGMLGARDSSPYWADTNLKVAPQGPARTSAKDYTGSHYGTWNGQLRENKGNPSLSGLDDFYTKKTKELDSIMYPVPEDIIVFRGTEWDEFLLRDKRTRNMPPPPPSELIGSVQTNHGYMSTSVGDKAAFSNRTVQIEIRVPEGHGAAWVKPYSSYPDENELLLQRDSNLFIHDVYQDRNGTWRIQAEVIPPGVDASSWIPLPRPHL